jgi:hypothetical protein
MRFPLLTLLTCVIALSACQDDTTTDAEGGAAHPGVEMEIDPMPEVNIDDELGTDVRAYVSMTHFGGPDAETLEIVSASLTLDLEHYADIELAIPADHPQFTGLADGDSFDFQLNGYIPDSHDEWGLCDDVQTEDEDELRVGLSVVLRVTPGANDDADEFEFEAMAVELGCSHTG